MLHEDVDWIRLAQNKAHWRAPVNSVMVFCFLKRKGISLSVEWLMAFEGDVCFMEFVWIEFCRYKAQ